MSTYKSSSILPSPRLFLGFSAKDSEAAAISPTSILETKPFSPVKNPFFTEKIPKNPLPWDLNADSKSIGLGIVDALVPDWRASSPESRMVLFGSRLKIQIPYVTVEAPQPPVEFGVKNKSAQLGLVSPAVRSPRFFSNVVTAPPSPGVFSGCLAAEEMELSEDYTKVVAHGPNPRTTHIFDNCIVERRGQMKKDKSLGEVFLNFCHACKKSLGQGKDIFMYRFKYGSLLNFKYDGTMINFNVVLGPPSHQESNSQIFVQRGLKYLR